MTNSGKFSYVITLDAERLCFWQKKLTCARCNYRCIRELAPELSEMFPTICELNSYFFELKLISQVSDRFLRSLSTSQVHLKKIGQGYNFTFLPYHVTRSHRARLAIFKTCSDSLNMGRVCLVVMPVVALQSFKMIGCLEVR